MSLNLRRKPSEVCITVLIKKDITIVHVVQLAVGHMALAGDTRHGCAFLGNMNLDAQLA